MCHIIFLTTKEKKAILQISYSDMCLTVLKIPICLKLGIIIISILGCSQVVRQRTLTPLFVGSSPTTPDFIAVFSISTYRKNGSYNKLHLTFRHFFCTLLFSRIRLELGLVAQWTRARGYEPRCQGFESLLARLKFYPISSYKS